MKNFNYALVLLVFGVVGMSFTSTPTTNETLNEGTELLLKIDLPTDVDAQGWGSWNTTDCLRGLDFRVRNDGYNKYAKKYRWSIQFRNRYKEKIHFSYKAVAPSERSEIRRSGRTTDRLHINGDYGKRSSYYLVKSSNSIYVYVNRIRIGPKDYGSGYYNCDK
jgi:hypothetical protein